MSNALTQQEIVTLTWHSLVSRSIKAWSTLHLSSSIKTVPFAASILRAHPTLDSFLSASASPGLRFWFLQLRSAFLTQSRIPKWSPDRLNEFVLLPAAPNFGSRHDVFFASHYWTMPTDPDPDGKYLRFVQAQLAPQEWKYIWLDWTCAPQAPRTENEAVFFRRTLESMSGLIRNSGFIYYYPSHRPRLWILYEIAEYLLTCTDARGADTEDISTFSRHVGEMLDPRLSGVKGVISKYGYDCQEPVDKTFLIAWLELLVLLHKLHLDLDKIRSIMDHLTWQPSVQLAREGTPQGWLEIRKFEGVVVYRGEEYLLTPFPEWGSYRPLLGPEDE